MPNIKTFIPSTKMLYATGLFVIFLLLAGDVAAQCPMCRASAESNLKNGGNSAAGLNAGILYMLSMPYFFLMLFGIYMYRRYKAKKKEQDGSNFIDLSKPEHLN